MLPQWQQERGNQRSNCSGDDGREENLDAERTRRRVTPRPTGEVPHPTEMLGDRSASMALGRKCGDCVEVGVEDGKHVGGSLRWH